MTYLISGTSLYKINNKINELKKDIDNSIIFNMSENTIEDVLTEASYLSMFSDKKCIIVKNANYFGTKITEDDKKVLEKIEKYIDNENKDVVLIFITNDKISLKNNIYKKLNDMNHVFIFNAMTKTDIKNELKEYVKEHKYNINDDLLWKIINNTNGNIDFSVKELEKIFIYYNKPCTIEKNVVDNLTSSSYEENNFKFVDAIINRDFDLSMKLLKESEILKIEPIVIINLIYREFRLMLELLICDGNGGNQKFNEYNNMQPWQIDKIRNNLRKYNKREIREEILKLNKLDYEYKSGKIPKEFLLIKYIVELCL